MFIFIAVEDNGTILHFSTKEVRDEYVELSGVCINTRDINLTECCDDDLVLDYK